MSDYQVIVIGAGPSGTAAACRLAKYGFRTAVISDERAGGTCLNRGCIPTKTLLYASSLVQECAEEKKQGIISGQAAVSIRGLFDYKDRVTGQLAEGAEKEFTQMGIDRIRGKATLMEDGRVRLVRIGQGEAEETSCIAGEDDKTDGPECFLTADRVILATGALPVIPPIPGIKDPHVYTSDQILQGADHLYSSVLIIGGGVIGVEFATFYSDLGSKVTIVEGQKQILPALDRETARSLTRILQQRGITVYTDSMVREIRQKEDGSEEVFLQNQKGQISVCAEAVICAVGRRPNMEGLFENPSSVSMERGRVLVDACFQTSLPNVYAIGDISSKIQLAHAASAQGRTCADIIASQARRENETGQGNEGGKDSTVSSAGVKESVPVPACIFTRPEVAVVGMDEKEAKEAGISAACGKAVLFSNARSVIAGADRSFMKILAARADGRIIGAQIMCLHASEMISEITEAIANHLTVSDMLKTIRPHPTFHEALTDALMDLERKM